MTDADRSAIALRPATSDDVPELVKIWFDTWHITSPRLTQPQPIELWEQRFRNEILPRETVLVAERHGQTCGFLALRESEGYVHLLYVSPSAQRSGVGSRLLAEAAHRCPTGLSLTTLESNDNARRFYERHGWIAGEQGQSARTGHPTVAYRWTPARCAPEN
jgi:ribosomal protein S18 acetylase RimI-like enzyme